MRIPHPALVPVFLLATFALGAQGTPNSPRTSAIKQTSRKKAPAPATPAPIQPTTQPTPALVSKPLPRVRLLTSYGPVVLELFPERAPKTVANFLRYVQEGHYKGTVFHRVIPDFMIQGGGMTEGLEEKPTHEPIPNEASMAFSAGLKNSRGTIAMARQEDPHSATSQFYINTADNPALDPNGRSMGYCAFGRVVEGMEIVDKISKVRTVWRKGMQDVPEFAVRISGAEHLAQP